jgi:hypothetical protein
VLCESGESGDAAGTESRLPCQGVEVWPDCKVPVECDAQEVERADGLDLLAVDVDSEREGGLPLPPTITCVLAPFRARPLVLV